MSEPLYSIRVESNGANRQTLLQITGARDTVLDAAVRVMLDCTPAWNPQTVTLPQFSVYAFTVK